jgi:predicted nucleic acid-binding protein
MGGATPRRRTRVKYLLDTTVLLDFVHDRGGAVELIDRLFAEAETLYTCDVVTCEALSGGDDLQRTVIGGILDALEYVALAPEGARWAAEARRSDRSAPGARSLADALITAATWSLSATLVTRNPRDFERHGIGVLRYG